MLHRVLLLSKSKKINCRLEFCAFLASTGHTEANVVPEKLIYRYTYVLPAKTHCPDGPSGSIFWCYLGQPSKMALQIYFLGINLDSVCLLDAKNAQYKFRQFFFLLPGIWDTVYFISYLRISSSPAPLELWKHQ